MSSSAGYWRKPPLVLSSFAAALGVTVTPMSTVAADPAGAASELSSVVPGTPDVRIGSTQGPDRLSAVKTDLLGTSVELPGTTLDCSETAPAVSAAMVGMGVEV